MEDGPSGFPRGFPCPGVLGCRPSGDVAFTYGAVTLCGGPSQVLLLTTHAAHMDGPTTPPGVATRRFGLFPFRSPLLRESMFLSVPAGTEMFQFPTLASASLCIQLGIRAVARGLPHSDISGSTPVRGSPKLFAAYHVLHRLLSPRHSP